MLSCLIYCHPPFQQSISVFQWRPSTLLHPPPSSTRSRAWRLFVKSSAAPCWWPRGVQPAALLNWTCVISSRSQASYQKPKPSLPPTAEPPWDRSRIRGAFLWGDQRRRRRLVDGGHLTSRLIPSDLHNKLSVGASDQIDLSALRGRYSVVCRAGIHTKTPGL